jgi:hypothetical protein
MAELQVVESAAPLRLRDIFERSRWQHVVLLTYTFDLPFFESYLLPLLVRNGARHVTVAADANWLREQLPRWIEHQLVREAGRRYALIGVQVPGAFHPKLTLGIGPQGGAVLLGSGNISVFGMATGGELFHFVEWVDAVPHPVAREAWQACRSLIGRLPIDGLFGSQVDAIAQDVPAITLSGSSQLATNLDEPLVSQLISQIRGEPVEEVLIWSPFSDRSLDALTVLVQRLRPKQVQLALQPKISGFDGDRLRSLSGAFEGVTWRFPRLVARFAEPPAPQPMIHAKGILIRLASGEEMLLAGSPNLSRPALLATASDGNFELAIITRERGLREALFGAGGPIALGENVNLDDISWRQDPGEPRDLSRGGSLRLLGAQWDGQVLHISIEGDLPADTVAHVVPRGAATAEAIETALPSRGDSGPICLNLAEAAAGFVPLSVTVHWANGASGPVIVSDLPSLHAASGESKKEVPALSAIDWGGDTELLAILDELAEIAIANVADIDRIIRGRQKVTAAEEASEAEGTAAPIDLSQIDFSRLAHHPRMRAYDSALTSGADPSRMHLLLDEIAQQFAFLEQRRLRLLTQSLSEEETEDVEPEPPDEPRRWSPSASTRKLWRNRLKRFVSGGCDPRFWDLAGPDVMAPNYILILELLRLHWDRSEDSKAHVLPRSEVGRLGLGLLSGFWGNDQQDGYWATLSDDVRDETGIRLLERRGDALTLAMADRFLSLPGAEGEDAPFVVAGFVRAVEGLGFLDATSEDDALDYLGDLSRRPGALLQRITETTRHFTWKRFCSRLVVRYSLHRAAVEVGARRVNNEPVDVLTIEAAVAIQDHPHAMMIFHQWVEMESRQKPERDQFHLIWRIRGQPGEDLLFWDQSESEFIWQHAPSPQMRRMLEQSDVTLEVLPNLSLSALVHEELVAKLDDQHPLAG